MRRFFEGCLVWVSRSSRGEIGGTPVDEADDAPPAVGAVNRSGGYVPEVIGEELPPALLEVGGPCFHHLRVSNACCSLSGSSL